MPLDHPIRGIDRFLDLSHVRPLLAPFYSSGGRPSIDPELMIRMLLLGYCMGIRSERRLCEEVHVNLVDLDNAVIVDVEATAPIRPAEARAARDMIDRVQARFGIKPGKLVGDTGYGSVKMLGWLVEDRKIAPHIPV